MNRLHLQDLVRGHYGRKIAYTNVDTITPDNIVNVVGECIGVFNWNKPIIKYLWNYYKGDQPIRYRTKVIRDDVINYIVENHAYEIVQFKVGQTYGEPVQYISRKDDDAINNAVDDLNDYMVDACKQDKDIKAGEWQSATGTAFKAISLIQTVMCRLGLLHLVHSIPLSYTTVTPKNRWLLSRNLRTVMASGISSVTQPHMSAKFIITR